MLIRHGFNAWGGLVGFLIAVCGVLILVGFFKLTWGFWSRLGASAMPKNYDGLFKVK